jgi:hypothetical protein
MIRIFAYSRFMNFLEFSQNWSPKWTSLELPRLTVCKFYINKIIFRLLMIIRILLLYLYLIQSFLGNCTKFLVTFIERIHYLDNLFIWLCERDYLRIIFVYFQFAEFFTYTNGIWILLFVITGPKFWGGFKNA